MNKYKIMPFTLNGLKQEPIDNDFHITPCLTFGNNKEDKTSNNFKGYALAIEWGYWAIGLILIKIINKQ